MFSRKEVTQTSQTEFMEETAFLEEKPKKKFNFQDFKKNKNLLPFYILIGILVFFFLLLILRMILNKKEIEPTNTQAVQEEIKLNPLTERSYKLRKELKEHDPTKQSIPFPQVDLEFNID